VAAGEVGAQIERFVGPEQDPADDRVEGLGLDRNAGERRKPVTVRARIHPMWLVSRGPSCQPESIEAPDVGLVVTCPAMP
jgi:hypothetical protein